MVDQSRTFLAGEFNAVQDEISAVVDACGDAQLKVILEVSELDTYDNIRAGFFSGDAGDSSGHFNQDEHGQGFRECDARQHSSDDRSHSRFLSGDGNRHRDEAGGRNQDCQAGASLSVAVKETLGDAWLNSTRTASAQARCPERSAAADRKGKDRRVSGAVLLHRVGGELLR